MSRFKDTQARADLYGEELPVEEGEETVFECATCKVWISHNLRDLRRKYNEPMWCTDCSRKAESKIPQDTKRVTLIKPSKIDKNYSVLCEGSYGFEDFSFSHYEDALLFGNKVASENEITLLIA